MTPGEYLARTSSYARASASSAAGPFPDVSETWYRSKAHSAFRTSRRALVAAWVQGVISNLSGRRYRYVQNKAVQNRCSESTGRSRRYCTSVRERENKYPRAPGNSPGGERHGTTRCRGFWESEEGAG